MKNKMKNFFRKYYLYIYIYINGYFLSHIPDKDNTLLFGFFLILGFVRFYIKLLNIQIYSFFSLVYLFIYLITSKLIFLFFTVILIMIIINILEEGNS